MVASGIKPLGSPRNTAAGLGAPPEQSTSGFAIWRRAAAPFALLSAAALLLVLTAVLAPAQQSPPVVPAPGELHIPPNTRVVEGKVTSADGTPVSNATVLLKDLKTLQIRSYITQTNGAYKFYGLSTDVNYDVRAETSDMTSPTKQISVFNSHKVTKIDLKIKEKKKAA